MNPTTARRAAFGPWMPLLLVLYLLTGCSVSEVKLSPARSEALTSRFVGREFVFRTDWYQGMWIYRGRQVNNKAATYYHETKSVVQAREQRGPLVAQAGDVATFTRLQTVGCCNIALHFKTESGRESFIILGTPNVENLLGEFYEDMTDAVATDAWVEEQLTRETVSWIDPAKRMKATAVELPAPPKQLVLKPAPPKDPVIETVTVKANPQRVARGQVLNLSIDYTLQAPAAAQVAVSETFTLLNQGKPLPSFPRTRKEQRGAGDHTVQFRLTIPGGAAQGSYTYQGEICIDSGCVSRKMAFEVTP